MVTTYLELTAINVNNTVPNALVIQPAQNASEDGSALSVNTRATTRVSNVPVHYIAQTVFLADTVKDVI